MLPLVVHQNNGGRGARVSPLGRSPEFAVMPAKRRTAPPSDGRLHDSPRANDTRHTAACTGSLRLDAAAVGFPGVVQRAHLLRAMSSWTWRPRPPQAALRAAHFVSYCHSYRCERSACAISCHARLAQIPCCCCCAGLVPCSPCTGRSATSNAA